MFNVKDFGATGDDFADDTDAIKNALTAASFDTPLYFPAGTLSSPQGLTLPGESW